jgi:hypothetical protein
MASIIRPLAAVPGSGRFRKIEIKKLSFGIFNLSECDFDDFFPRSVAMPVLRWNMRDGGVNQLTETFAAIVRDRALPDGYRAELKDCLTDSVLDKMRAADRETDSSAELG